MLFFYYKHPFTCYLSMQHLIENLNTKVIGFPSLENLLMTYKADCKDRYKTTLLQETEFNKKFKKLLKKVKFMRAVTTLIAALFIVAFFTATMYFSNARVS